MKECSNCKSQAFVTDSATGDVYCTNCGLVIQDFAFEFARVSEDGYSLSPTDAYAPSNNITSMGPSKKTYGLHRILRVIDYRNQVKLYKGFRKELDILAYKYNIPQHLKDDALRIYKNSSLQILYYNMTCKVMACLVMAYEINNMYFNYKRVIGFNRRIFNKSIKALRRENAIPYKPKDYKVYLQDFTRRLSFSSSQIAEVEQCIETYNKYSWTLGIERNNATITVGAIYYIAHKHHQPLDAEELSIISGLGVTTIFAAYKELRQCLDAEKEHDSISKRT